MADGIGAFWTWWKTAKRTVAGAIEANGVDDKLSAEISRRVERIAEGMRWEVGPSDTDVQRYTFALTWDGSLARRRAAQRWAESAPRDKRWEIVPARPPGSGWERMEMVLDNHRVKLGDFVCRVAVDGARERVDVVLHHPAGAKAGEHVHGNAAYLMLDRAFGEDGVERWLGRIDVTAATPEDAVPVRDLVRAVRKLAKGATGDQFQLLQGERDGLPVFVMRNAALKAIDHLVCDHHVELRIPLAEPTDAGLTTNAEADRLNALEDAFLAAFPQLAYHGRETHGGARTMLVFAPADAVTKRALAAWAKRHRAKLTWRADPEWSALRRWSA